MCVHAARLRSSTRSRGVKCVELQLECIWCLFRDEEGLQTDGEESRRVRGEERLQFTVVKDAKAQRMRERRE